jgi:hypothetical protein
MGVGNHAALSGPETIPLRWKTAKTHPLTSTLLFARCLVIRSTVVCHHIAARVGMECSSHLTSVGNTDVLLDHNDEPNWCAAGGV